MHRLSAFPPCALLVCVLSAASAPPANVWVAGWDRPADPPGDRCFDRKGDRLTITVPADGRSPEPRLLREVKGDFQFQVRLSGDFQPGGNSGVRGAGILLLSGKDSVVLQRHVWLPPPSGQRAREPYSEGLVASLTAGNGSSSEHHDNVTTLGKTASLLLERRGRTLLLKASQDGKRWRTLQERDGFLKLPQTVKVGVFAFAEAKASATFKATFDQFKLTPLGADGRPLNLTPAGGPTR